MLLVPGGQAFRYLLSISFSPLRLKKHRWRWNLSSCSLEDKKSEPKIRVADERAGKGG
jgi:hypothetical protein